MFSLHERLLYLAHSLEGAQSEVEGSYERFYRGSPGVPGRLFLEVVEARSPVYGLPPCPGCRFRTGVLLPHPRYPGWVQLDPLEEDEEALWQSIRYAHQQALAPLPSTPSPRLLVLSL